MKRTCLRGLIELSVVLLILGGRTRLLADVMVENGTDYLQTFISAFNGATVKGVPIDPATLGGTDTIIKRLADADVVSGSGAFDLLVSALQLETTTPTTFGGTLPLNTYFLSLSPAIPSTGSIMFNINAADTGGGLSLFLSLFLDVHAGALTGPVVNFGGLTFATSASWITTPLAGNLIVMGGDTDTVPVQSQELNANLHTGLDAGEYDFFLPEGFTLSNGGTFFDILQPAAGVPVAGVPEPSSFFLLLAVVAGLGWSRRIKSKFS